MFPEGIEVLGLIILFVFGIGLFIYRIPLFWDEQKNKLFNDNLFMLGLISSSFSGVILLIYFLQISALFFFLWLIFFVVLLLTYDPEKDEKSIQRFVKKLKKVEKNEKIKIWDLFTGKMIYKLILQRGPEYAAKVFSLQYFIVFFLSFNLTMYLISDMKPAYMLCNLSLFAVLASVSIYPKQKKLYEIYLENYEEPYTEDYFGK